MGTKSLLSAVVLSASLVGCASSPPTMQGFNPKDDVVDCTGNKCNVVVEMNRPDRPCPISRNCLNVTMGEFAVIGGGATPTITWSLTGTNADDFEFDPGETGQPIKFLNDSTDFDCTSPPRDKPVKEVSCKKLASSNLFKIYKYQISGRPFKGIHAPVTPLDPWVINK
jgi:hypothetical protein